MSYSIQGTVKDIMDLQTFASGFKKRSLIITFKDGNYDNDLALDFIKDNVSKLDSIKRGDKVDAKFSVKSNEHNGRYFTNAVAYNIGVIESAPMGGGMQPNPEFAPQPHQEEEEEDDLPF